MRPFCVATIGVILGIIMGLYLESMALFVLCLIIFAFSIVLFYVIAKTVAKKYIKATLIFFICFFSFWGYTYFLESRYNAINQTYNKQEVEIKAIVVSDKVEKEYKDVYQIKVIDIITKNNEAADLQGNYDNLNKKSASKEHGKYINFKLILNLKKDKSSNIDLQYGDEIRFTSTYEEASTSRNDGGFDYKQYLKTKKVAGITSVKSSEIEIIETERISLSSTIHNIRNNAVLKIKEVLPTDTANLCTSLLLGEKTELSEDIQDDFKKSNLSHMLAISGAHISYILLGITAIIKKLKLHKRWSKILVISFLIFFMSLVGFTPSVTRACIMAILQLLAGILFKKSDTYQNLAISSFVILLFNPYAILDIGFQLSFGGTIGIIIFSNKLLNEKNSLLCVNIVQQKVIKSIKEMCIVTLSANLLIIPIIMYHFNTFSLTFLVSNLLASPVLGVGIILSMIFLIALLIFQPLAKVIAIFLQPVLQLLITIAKFSSNLPFSQILVPTPTIWQIILYYIILGLAFWVKSNNNNTQNAEIEESLIKFSKILKYKKPILILIIIIIISPYILKIFPNNKLTIHFIDVGQGDSMLIQTPSNKTVLIDGGGSEIGSFDVGEKTLLPYLLDKGVMKIDYMMFSHFDSDHCERITDRYGET